VARGSGTVTDPYVIEGWEIVTNASVGISISNTNAHFIVQDVHVNAGNYEGILLDTVTNGTIRNSTITGSRIGIRTFEPFAVRSNLAISGNHLDANGYGMTLYGSDLTVEDNEVVNSSGFGIDAFYARAISVTGNALSSNRRGVSLICSDGATIAENVLRNQTWGVDLESTSHVSTYHNDFINSTVWDGQYIDGVGCNVPWYQGTNGWDNGYPSGGNYWSTIATVDVCRGPLQNDCTSGDGIDDFPLPITSNETDRYPLVRPSHAEIPITRFALYGNAVLGWGYRPSTIASPGPTLVAYVGIPLNLTLYGTDNMVHQWFLDLNGNSTLDAGEPHSEAFQLGPIWFDFTPSKAGNFSYRCAFHSAIMLGTLAVLSTPSGSPATPAPVGSTPLSAILLVAATIGGGAAIAAVLVVVLLRLRGRSTRPP
jgi:hypothetical protein